MKKTLRIFIMFLSFIVLSCNDNYKNKILIITNVYDGDTIYFNDGSKGRILGIDALMLSKICYNWIILIQL